MVPMKRFALALFLICLLVFAESAVARTVYRCLRNGTVSLATAPEPGSKCTARHIDDNAAKVPNLWGELGAIKGTLYERVQDGKAVYAKLRDAGRGLPDGLKFVASYVTADLGRCFQLMETDDITLFQRWIADWQDVVEFEVVPVVEGKTTREALAPIL